MDFETFRMAKTPESIRSFATAQLSLLASELAAETSSTSTLLNASSPTQLSRAGLAILNLILSSQRTGLGGKLVLELESDPATSATSSGTSSAGSKGPAGEGEGIGSATEHAIRTGDIVRVSPQPKGSEKKRDKDGLEKKGGDGVVVKVLGKGGVNVALDREDVDLEGLGGRLWV